MNDGNMVDFFMKRQPVDDFGCKFLVKPVHFVIEDLMEFILVGMRLMTQVWIFIFRDDLPVVALFF